jgi:hypothetical protein
MIQTLVAQSHLYKSNAIVFIELEVSKMSQCKSDRTKHHETWIQRCSLKRHLSNVEHIWRHTCYKYG